jgi:polyisoprenoid-binding protein YceI
MSSDTLTHPIPAGTHEVDRVHSTIGFAVRHAGVSTFRGGFSDYAITLDGGGEPRLRGWVDVDSIRVDDAQLKGHLLSPEFFDAARHARLEFESSELRVDADGELTVRGRLSIAGHSREVEARGRVARNGGYLDGRPRVGLSLEAAIDRRDFGLDWQAELPGGGEALDWRVEIAVDLQFVPEDE